MAKQNDATERQKYMDIFRSFGIILMIMGHVGFGNKFDFFIHAFHMPMFFVISGFFFRSGKDITPSTFILKKAKSLLVPYIFFGLFHYFISTLFNRTVYLGPLFHLLFINTRDLPIAGALWFLTALFITDVLYYLIDRYITNEDAKWIIIIAIAGFGNCAGYMLPFTLPYAASAALVGVGLFHMGYLMRRYESTKFMRHMLNMPLYEWLVCTIVAIFLIFQNGYISMRTDEYDGILLFWINVYLAVIVGINLSKYIYKLIHDTYICKWLCSVGRNSIVYLCLNQLVITLIMDHIAIPFGSWLLEQLFILCLTLLILPFFSLLFTKTKLRILIGK